MAKSKKNEHLQYTAAVYDVVFEEVMHNSMLPYSENVILDRALPRVEDGLKPVQRRILYAMHEMGLTPDKPYKKSARIVGDCLGKYHPHGDSSVYGAMVRMAQPFSMRMKLIDGHGNFGSADGDPPAAMRYTEARMSPLALELLRDLDKDTVNMIPNFDESETEPEVLPAKFPNLLVNGSMGIGVGMATNIPPHNLGEVVDGTLYLLDHPTATVAELMKYIPGPDFPTGGIIYGINPIRDLYTTGHGVIKVRAKAEIVETKSGGEQIIVTEIPYAVNKEMLVKRIADLVREKKITGISGLRDETSRRTGIRIVIDIKRGAMSTVVLNQLFAHTQMENAFGCNVLVVDMNRPRTLNLLQILQRYIDHRLEVVTRRTRFDLAKTEARIHILEGLLLAVRNLDEVVRIIRASRTRAEAQETLMARYNFSKIQVTAILDMRLYQLTGLAIEDLEKEYKERCEFADYLRSLLASRDLRIGVIKSELLEVKGKYADPRRTDIAFDEGDIDIADLIPRHSCVITVSNTGYIKRVPADTYQTQHRGGIGIIGMETKDEDHVEHLFNADSHDIILFFTNKGVMHWLNVYEIPEGARTGKGKAIVNLIKIDQDEQIRAMLTIRKSMFEENEELCIAMATKRGVIKKTPLSQFRHLRKIGIRALSIDEGDDLIGAELVGPTDEIILSTAKGMACRFKSSDVRAMGRTARGVTGLRFKIEGDWIVSMEVVPSEEEPGALPPDGSGNLENAEDQAEPAAGEEPEVPEEDDEELEPASDEEDSGESLEDTGKPQILIVTSGGMGKRSYVEDYRLTRRGAKGVKNLNLREGEEVVAAVKVRRGDELIITTERGQVVRISVDEIRIVGRASRGVKIMELRKGDRITGVACLIKVEGQKPQEAEVAVESGVSESPAESSPDAPETPAADSTGGAPESPTDSSEPAE